MPKDIAETRNNIAKIDKELVSLLKKRFDYNRDVAAYKAHYNLPIYNQSVEEANIERISKDLPHEISSYVVDVYKSIMEGSKAFQTTLYKSNDILPSEFRSALELPVNCINQSAKVAIQGEYGAYSHIASNKFFSNPTLKLCTSFKDVFLSVEKGECEFGVLPIENSTAGSVNQVYDLMKDFNFYIVSSLRLRISHNLLVKKGTRLENIRRIYTHPQAIAQCSNFLSTLPNIDIIPDSNTAASAKRVATIGESCDAAICSTECSEIYSLDILKRNIQNYDDNFTRFICISKNCIVLKNATRASFMVVLPNKQGSLYSLLSSFNLLGINLLKIESRSLPGRNFEFMFYLDIEIDSKLKNLAALYSLLQGKVEQIVYLGSYAELQ